MTARLSFIALIGAASACADPEEDVYRLTPCNGTRLPAPMNPIVCPDRVIRYDEAAAVTPGGLRCVPFMGTPCRCDNGAQGVDTCSTFGHPSGCFCDLPSAPGDIEGMGAPPPPLPPRLVSPLSGMRATTQRPTFRWVLPDGITRSRIELCDDRPCTRLRTRTEVAGRAWRPPPLRPGVVFWRVTGLSTAGAPMWTSATWEAGIPYRDTPVDSVNGPIRDINGDRVDDVVLRTAYADRSMYLSVTFVPGYLGAVQQSRPTVYSLDREWDPLNSDMALGDVNGDGMGDLLTVTSSGDLLSAVDPAGSGLVTFNPAAFLLLGGAECPFAARVELPIPLPHRDFLRAGSIGDFDGDGFGDVVVGSDVGTYLYAGSALGALTPPNDFVALAAMGGPFDPMLRFAGDVNGDGYADVALGDSTASDGDGKVTILYGNPRGRLDEHVQVLRPRGGAFGRTITAADFTGDGVSDLVVGSYHGFDLFTGAPTGLRPTQYVRFPPGILAPTGVPGFFPVSGDFDGDGRPELTTFAGGGTYRYAGNAGFLVQPVAVYGGMIAGGGPASHLASPGDINGDGFDDVFASGPQGSSETRAVLFFLHLGGSVVFCSPVFAWGTSASQLTSSVAEAIHP